MILEGMTGPVQLGANTYLDWADHTWVRVPAIGQKFECWGGSNGTRLVVSGNGSYNRANCYRCNIWPFRDTAGIGIYAIDGVCHQSANCFLYTAGRTLNTTVRGYWFSVFSYGVYGRSFWRWLVAPYGTCSWSTSWAPQPMALSATGDGGGEEDDEPAAEEDPVIGIVRDVYVPSFSRGQEKHPHELLVEETEKVTKHFVPEMDYEKVRRIQMDYLQKRDDVIARGHKEDQLAKRLDDLARKVQKDLLKVVGTEHYEQLMGVKPDQQLGIVEPGLVGAAGVPVPPPEVQMQMSTEQSDTDVRDDPEESTGDHTEEEDKQD
jgi:hypothetical protein